MFQKSLRLISSRRGAEGTEFYRNECEEKKLRLENEEKNTLVCLLTS